MRFPPNRLDIIHRIMRDFQGNDSSKSTRTDIYYGITDSAVGDYGPALRTADGMKIILGGWGGAKGQFRLLNESYVDAYPLLTSTVAGSLGSAVVWGSATGVGDASCQLNVTNGFCCPGDSVGSVPCKDTATCCSLCAAHEGCTSFTMRFDSPPTCWLKSAARVSSKGNCDCGHPGPLPPKGPPPGPSRPSHPNMTLLYDVETDPGEATELSAAHADVVAKLQAIVLQHQKVRHTAVATDHVTKLSAAQ